MFVAHRNDNDLVADNNELVGANKDNADLRAYTPPRLYFDELFVGDYEFFVGDCEFFVGDCEPVVEGYELFVECDAIGIEMQAVV